MQDLRAHLPGDTLTEKLYHLLHIFAQLGGLTIEQLHAALANKNEAAARSLVSDLERYFDQDIPCINGRYIILGDKALGERCERTRPLVRL